MYQNQFRELVKNLYLIAVTPRLTEIVYPWVCLDVVCILMHWTWVYIFSFCFSKTLKCYPYSYIWPRGIVGSGLLVLRAPCIDCPEGKATVFQEGVVEGLLGGSIG